jgi:orotidine 5'-phosphate decarboxylase subfamily 2
MTDNFFDKILNRAKSIHSLLCVGLDPHISELKLDKDSINNESDKCDAAYSFCKTIIDATAEYAVAYKPNAAFFESLGPNDGMKTLMRVSKYIRETYDIPILLDCKRGDIGSTAAAYAESSYEHLYADGVTLSPLMGWDSIAPFVTDKYLDKGAFLLCKTSNPGSNDVLTLETKKNNQRSRLYEEIASLTKQYTVEHGAGLGLVVGATDIDALRNTRKTAGDDVWILAPGVGFQGGDLEGTLEAALNSDGYGLLIPISRGISRAENIGEKAKEYRDLMNNARESILSNRKSTCTSEVAQYQREFIEFSLQLGVLKFGSFVLKSGRTSPYFFNAGLFCNGGALYKLGQAYADSIIASKALKNDSGDIAFDIIFGPAYKGISLGAIVASALYEKYGVDVGFAYNRKEAKDHGEGGKLVGASMEGKRILIVDDVITAGTAIRESVEMLRTISAIPVGVSIALDRAEKRSLEDPVSAVQSVVRDLNIPVISIVSLPQLQGFLRENTKYGEETLASVSEYRNKYGV